VVVAVALEIRPLLEEKAALQEDVATLRQTLADHRAQVDSLRDQVERYRLEVAALEREKASLREELQRTRELLERTLDMSRFAHPIDPVDVKMLASRHPEAARALRDILEMREKGVGWKLGGRSEDEGFDSPGFAAYVLKKMGVLDEGIAVSGDLIETSRRLFSALQPVDRPGIGDLAFYPSGYALFYYEDQNGEPFVIGMTPTGIAALDKDFARILGYRRSGLAR
jgi:hypothetical protein